MSKTNSTNGTNGTSEVTFSVMKRPANLGSGRRGTKYQAVITKLQAMKVGDDQVVGIPVPKDRAASVEDVNTFRQNLVQNINRHLKVGSRIYRDDKGQTQVLLFPSNGRAASTATTKKASKKS